MANRGGLKRNESDKSPCKLQQTHLDYRGMSLGRVIYHLYHRPNGSLKKCLREGGPIEQWRTESGRKEMEAAAYKLRAPVISRQVPANSAGEGIEKPLEIHMLVGTKYWYMAAYAVVSLQRQVGRRVHVHFYNDGSLEQTQREKLGTLAPFVSFQECATIDERIEHFLPEVRFPFIRERLRNYPNLKKLVHPHLGSSGFKLLIDADVLFFQLPTELLHWNDNPSGVLCATDVVESYGYSRSLMEGLANAPVPANINVGITGLQSESLDWEQLEHWCGELITLENTNYYLEQALIAMLCAKRSFTQLNRMRYLTGPSDGQVASREGVMQHYVDLSKKEYYRSAWRQFAANA